MNKKGILIVVSGFSGAGKGTLMKELMRKYPENYALSISATTRGPRDGEVDGREYFFLSREKFEKMIANNELIEYAKYVENYYGTPRAYVEKMLDEGKDVILEIEIQGALKVKEKFPDTLLMFVTPPNARELKSRLVGRGTETMEVIESRMNRACEEAEGVNSRYSIVMATSKRARQLIAGELPLVPAKDGQKPLSIAIEELNEGELKILPEDTDEE